MPRLVKYAILPDAAPPTCVVGPPCTNTTYGGSSPSGAVDVGVGRRVVERVDGAVRPVEGHGAGLRHPFVAPRR